MSYCTVQQVRDFGVRANPSDATVQAGIDLADETINNYCGVSQPFGSATAQTVVVNDVRNPIVVLPTPFATITAVQVNGAAIDSTSYIVEKWGIRLYTSGYFDSDGFPRWQNATYGAGNYFTTGPWGAQVSVTATFGYGVIPFGVTQASKMLAARFLCWNTNNLVVEDEIKEVMTEGYRLIMQDRDKWSRIHTTGDVHADRLLGPYQNIEMLVG